MSFELIERGAARLSRSLGRPLEFQLSRIQYSLYWILLFIIRFLLLDLTIECVACDQLLYEFSWEFDRLASRDNHEHQRCCP
jgi:hypothetical protein